MSFEDLEMFYKDFKNGIIPLDSWIAICTLGLEDIIKEYEKTLKEEKEKIKKGWTRPLLHNIISTSNNERKEKKWVAFM